MMTYREWREEALKSLEKFNILAREHSFAEFLNYDHICYKSDSHQTFEEVRRMFEPESHYMYESWVAGRLIAIFKLKSPIEADKGEFAYVELHDLKPNAIIRKGFYHIEMYPKDLSYTEALERLQSKGLLFKEDPTPHHPIHELLLPNGFGLRLESEAIISKIINEEMQ